jgi:3-oxoacyl-[acyl-carrier-protein] synthase II
VTAERDVYITGIGLITCLGVGTADNWKKLCGGVSGIRLVRRFDTSGCPTRIGGEIPEEFPALFAQRFSKRTQKHTAVFSQLSLLATALALEDAGLRLEAEEDRGSIGICVGTGAGGLSYWEEQLAVTGKPYRESLDTVESLAVIKYMANAPAASMSLHFGVEGPSLTVSSSCSSGAYAVCHAHDLIRMGRAEVMIAGGVDAIVSRAALLSFGRLQALSERNCEPARASRPFDKLRDGFVLGDGAGFLVLESAEHCRRRDARRYARIRGHAATSEASHLVHPSANGGKMADTMRRALADAGVATDEVDYISAHGTSTVLNDKYETAAIKQVFGPYAPQISISSQKSMLGHTVGAAGAIEAAVTALTVAHDVVPPTINYENPDEECDLDYTPNVARKRVVRVALSNSFGFGGHNFSIIVSKP